MFAFWQMSQKNTNGKKTICLCNISVGIPGNPDPEIPGFQPIFANPDSGIVCRTIPRLQCHSMTTM